MKTSKLLLSSMLFIALISACSTEQEKKKIEFIKIDTIEKNKKNENLNIHLSPIDTFYNNLTQLLGGKDTVFSFSNNWDTEFIKKYARKVNEKYKKIETNRLKKMGDWNQKNLKRNNQSDTSFVFYPFSGGDFIHLSWMFPKATQYLMVAQEDVGNIPDLYNQDSKFVNKYLSEIDTVLRDIYYKSYFITKNMIEDTKVRSKVNGMLPLIIWALARTEHEIVSIKFGNVNPNGVIEFAAGIDQKNKPKAVEIMFRKKNTVITKTLTYVSCNISDQGFNSESKFYTYLNNKIPKNCNSFVKSASYLLHYITFKQIRDLIKNKSQFLVQDDTGIPFSNLIQDKCWKIELFGKYEKPVKDFSENLFQSDLDSAFKNESYFKGNIDFSLGYHWGSQNQNQMVLRKIN